MTIEDALKTTPGTDEFDAAVEFLSDLCEARDKAAYRPLEILLQRNDDYLHAAVHYYRFSKPQSEA